MNDTSKITRGNLTLNIARHTDTAPAFGFSVRMEGKETPIASAGVYVHGVHDVDFTPEEIETHGRVIFDALSVHAETGKTAGEWKRDAVASGVNVAKLAAQVERLRGVLAHLRHLHAESVFICGEGDKIDVDRALARVDALLTETEGGRG